MVIGPLSDRETRRKRIAGHDWCIIGICLFNFTELGLQGQIVGFDVDTAYFTGNNTPAISIQAANIERNTINLQRESVLGSCALANLISKAEAVNSEKWVTILEKSPLKAGYETSRHNLFEVHCKETWTHLRVNMYPDGGIARLSVFGIVKPDWSTVQYPLDLVSLKHG
jgi:allantoicase